MEIELIDSLISTAKYLKTAIKKRDKLSEKAFNMSRYTHSPRQIEKTNVDLNWQCMEVDKIKTDFARLFKGSLVDVGTGEKEYNPSGFHSYKY